MSIEYILQKVPLKHYNHKKLCHRHAVESCLVVCSHAFQRNLFLLGNAMSPQEHEDNFAFVNRVYLLFFFKRNSVWKVVFFFFLIWVWFYYCRFNWTTQKVENKTKKIDFVAIMYSNKSKITSCLLKSPFAEYYGFILCFFSSFVCLFPQSGRKLHRRSVEFSMKFKFQLISSLVQASEWEIWSKCIWTIKLHFVIPNCTHGEGFNLNMSSFGASNCLTCCLTHVFIERILA